MSLLSRRNALSAKKEEITACNLTRDRRLKSLYLVTQLVGGHPKYRDLHYDAPPSPDQLRFLEDNDISKGRLFHESTLPTPEIISPPPTQSSNLRASPPSKAPSPLSPVSNSTNRLTSSQERQSPTPVPQKQHPSLSLATPSAASPTPPRSPSHATESTSSQADAVNGPTETAASKDALSSDSAVVPQIPMEDAQPTQEEDPANLISKPKERPAKVIHLPPKEVQEKHLRDIERAQEHARIRERKEDESMGLSITMPIPDAVSSPSSTAGAYSTSTPKPPHHSPDTSPDAEYSPNTRRDPRSATPEAESLLSKGSHAEDVEMDSGSTGTAFVTPEEQLRHEEEQAARESANSFGTPRTNTADCTNGLKGSSLAPESNGASSDSKTDKPESNSTAPRQVNSEPSTAFRTPKRPSVNTNVNDLDVEMGEYAQVGGTPASATPASTSRATADQPARRMTTRVASGAIRQKSVSEILGETPRPSAPLSERRTSQQHTTESPLNLRETATTPTEDKARHSMVVFSKKEKSLSPIRGNRYEPDGYLALKGASEDPEKDYLRPLFLHQAYLPPRAVALTDLIADARKTVNTTNMYSNLREGMDYRILRRIYQLQNANKWSLRQMARFPDPAPPITHQNHLMAEMKWMRTDFREERNWKAAAARRLAQSCAIYFAASVEEKAELRIKSRIPAGARQENTTIFEELPELVHSASTESGDSLRDEDLSEGPLVSTIAPTALFSLGYDDVVFELDPTPARDGILNELPLYDTKPLQPSPFISAGSSSVLIQVSKYSSGKMVPKSSSPLKKRSRYDYESEEDESATEFPTNKRRERRASEVSLFTSPARLSPRYKELPPEETDVALFNPLNRHIRERLHANHAFRPPSEFQMPSTSFFEHRIASQWTWDEDQKLRLCVKKFSYNWSLIAMELQEFSQPSMYVAASERRTPWECFERWYQLEGLPNDMDKTTYFRTYRSRIEAANRTVAAQHQAAQQNQGPGAIQPARRRPSTQPYRVERRRDSRYINMIDAIRKLARKRETAQHRQQEATKAAALRKQHTEGNQTRNTGIHTPQEFSRMKWEREQKMAERQEIYRQQMLQQQRNAQLQRSQMQGQQQGAAGGAGPQQRNGTANGNQGPSPPGQMSNGQPGMNGLARHPSQNMMQNGLSNGSMNGVGMNIPQAQMQGMQGQHRMASHGSQDNLQMAMARQRAAHQAQMQQQQAHQRTNLAAAHLTAPNANFQNPQMMAASLAGRTNGMSNGVGGSPGSATSPRGFHPGQNQIPQQGQQLSSGHTPALLHHQQQVALQFPHFTPEEIQKLANERLKGQMQRMQATALSAASGSPAPSMGNMGMSQGSPSPYHTNGIPGGHSPTQYQQQVRLQQQQQQQTARLSGSPSMSNARPVSRSATPQGQGQQPLLHQRVGSGPGMPEESPRLPQAQMARP